MEPFNEGHSSCEADPFQPLLDFIREKKIGRNPPPYIPLATLLPVHKLCKLALLWQEAGFGTEAGRLANWVGQLEPFLPLWCSERDYDEEESKKLFSHLSKIQPVAGEFPDLDLTIVELPRIKAALTLDGNGTSLGMIRSGDVEIRAFGPQTGSLQFGIKGRGMNGWCRTAAYPEIWLEMKHKTVDGGLKLDFRFIGIKPETPLSLSFYVKAGSCQVKNEVLKPKSLRRFHGEADLVTFDQKLKIQCDPIRQIEVIPLAGEGCFWNAEFLISFELYAYSNQASFLIS